MKTLKATVYYTEKNLHNPRGYCRAKTLSLRNVDSDSLNLERIKNDAIACVMARLKFEGRECEFSHLSIALVETIY